MQHSLGFSFLRRAAVAGLLLAVGASASAQLTTVYQEDFSSAPLKRDLLGASTTGWRRNTPVATWPKENTLTVQQEAGKRFATITAQGDKTFNARIGARNFPALDPISDSTNNYYSVDLRQVTPGSAEKNNKGGTVQFRNGMTNVLGMGMGSNGQFVFSLGKKTLDSGKLTPAIVGDSSKWYRLRTKLEPGNKLARVQVVEVVDGKEGAVVLDETMTDLALDSRADGLELQVRRPSPRANEVNSMDFANIQVGNLP